MINRLLFILFLSIAFQLSNAQQVKSISRIITAGSVITEIVCELGYCTNIVATDQTSIYPPEMNSLPSIGYRTGISAEGILAQRPTLILVEKEYVRVELAQQLEATGVPFYQFDKPVSLADTKKLILKIGTILGKEQEAGSLISRIDKELDDVKRILQNTNSTPRVLFIYARGVGTQMIAGNETFANNLIRMAGGIPAVDVTGYKPLNTEALIMSNPDYILFGHDGLQSLGGTEGVLAIQGMTQTNAGKRKNIISLDMVMMSNFGPRLPKAVKELVLLIHPEAKI